MERRRGMRTLIGIGLLALVRSVSLSASTMSPAAEIPAASPAPEIFCQLANELSCHALSDGRLVWRSDEVAAPGDLLPGGGRLWVTQSADLLALDIRNGRQLQRLTLPARLFSPRLYQGRLLLTDESGWLTVVDADDGHRLWRRRLSSRWVYPPAVSAGRLYAGGADGVVTALAAEDGRVLWRRQLEQELVYSPETASGRLWVSTFDGHLRALNLRSGQVEIDLTWSTPLFELQALGPLLLAADYSGNLVAFDSKDGRLLWQKKVSGSQRFGFSAGGRWILVSDALGQVQLLDVGNADIIKRFRFESAHPGAAVITDSMVWLFPREQPVQNGSIRPTGWRLPAEQSPGGEP